MSVVRLRCEKHETTDAARGVKAGRAAFTQSSLREQLMRKATSAVALTKRQSHIQVAHLIALRLSAFREASQAAGQSAARELGISGQTLQAFLVRSQPVDSKASVGGAEPERRLLQKWEVVVEGQRCGRWCSDHPLSPSCLVE